MLGAPMPHPRQHSRRNRMCFTRRPTTPPPLFSFGVISDVQYADIPDGCSFSGVPRFYRHSLAVLQRAVRKWNRRGNLDFVMNFGDIVDGLCPRDRSLPTVRKVVREFDAFHGPVRHIVGNHCLYNLPRDLLLPILNIPGAGAGAGADGRAYYDFSPDPGYRFVVLDGYDVSAIGRPRDHPKTQRAGDILRERNPNRDKNSPAGLRGAERRFVAFNGAAGEEQVGWLEGVLREAEGVGQRVVVCSHLPLDPGAASPEALLWNWEEVMRVVHRSGCVVACLSGHDHRGGHSLDSYGVHHRVFEAALECPPGTDAYGCIDVYADRLCLSGAGRMRSGEMRFPGFPG